MTSLLLKFKGPLQAWGADSRYQSRQTHHVPTKSAVIGLLAAAEGRRRSDPVEDLVGLEFGVRVDQPGTLLRDFQTAIDWRKGPPGKLSQRYYLSDAVFLAAVAGPEEFLDDLALALKAPRFPLYLGRRACPVGSDLVLGKRTGDVETSLRAEPWVAAAWHRRTRPTSVELPIYRDAHSEDDIEERVRDIPLSFDPVKRDYGWRAVHAPAPVAVENPEGTQLKDPFWEALTR